MSSNTLGNDEWPKTGTSLFSEDGSIEFKMQGDGKIAMYWGGKCQWENSDKQRKDVKGIHMQKAGSPCLQRQYRHPAVQNDGNVVLYKDTPIWDSKTQKPPK